MFKERVTGKPKVESIAKSEVERALAELDRIAQNSPETLLQQAVLRVGYPRKTLVKSLAEGSMPSLDSVGKQRPPAEIQDVIANEIQALRQDNPQTFNQVVENYVSLLKNSISPGMLSNILNVISVLSDSSVDILASIFRKSYAADLSRANAVATNVIIASDSKEEAKRKVNQFVEVFSN